MCLRPATIGVCVDVNHLNLREPDLAAALRTLGPRVLTLHCSDNDGVDERHWFPGAPGGVVNWAAFLSGLRAIGYAGPFLYETRALDVTPPEALSQIESNYAGFVVPRAGAARDAGQRL